MNLTHCPIDGRPLVEHETRKACDDHGLHCGLDGILITEHPRCAGCGILFGNNHLEHGPADGSSFCGYCLRRRMK